MGIQAKWMVMRNPMMTNRQGKWKAKEGKKPIESASFNPTTSKIGQGLSDWSSPISFQQHKFRKEKFCMGDVFLINKWRKERWRTF
jgi:hypothetical protein